MHLLHVEPRIPSGFATGRAHAILGDDVVDNFYKKESGAVLVSAEKILRDNHISFHASYKIGDVAVKSNPISQKTRSVLRTVATKVLATTTVPVLIVR